MQTSDPYTLILAQNGAVPMPGEATALPAAGSGAPGGAPGAGGAPANKSAFGPEFMFIMLALLVVMIVVSSMGPRRERKKKAAMNSAMKKHDRVQTVGGVIGAIVEIKPDFVVLKVDESANTRITFARSAIQQILSSDDTSASESSIADQDRESSG